MLTLFLIAFGGVGIYFGATSKNPDGTFTGAGIAMLAIGSLLAGIGIVAFLVGQAVE